MKNLYKEINDIVEIDKPIVTGVPLEITLHLAKLMEEVGELAQAVNKVNGRKGMKGESLEQVFDNIEEEAADAIQCIMAIAIKSGVDYKSLKKRLASKNQKYANSLNKK